MGDFLKSFANEKRQNGASADETAHKAQSAEQGVQKTSTKQVSERVANIHDLHQKDKPLTKREKQKEARLREADEIFNAHLGEITAFSKSDWDEWVAHKIARCGVRFTAQTWKNDILKLINAGIGAKAMIEHSIACAYQGLYPPRNSSANYQNGAQSGISADGLPFFSNKYDEHNFIVKELLKDDDEGEFFMWNDEQVANARVLEHRILKINGFFAFVREQKRDTG